MVGCVLVRDGKIIGEGFHHAAGQPQAEVEALRSCADPKGATAYVTLEPCQMCAGAIVQSRLGKVVIGSMNPKAGCAGSVLNLLQMKQFNHQVEIQTGVLQDECSSMLSEFFQELREKKKSAKS
jgi:tRNA(adenine34) deaminase